jgi:hypothetical protein
VRYGVTVVPEDVHLCHCRMCQKQVGGPFAVIAPVDRAGFTVTRGTIAWFQSSALARRGFCRDCGTPLIFEYPASTHIGVMAGTFDEPDRVPPVIQYGNEGRVAWYAHIAALPGLEATYEDDPNAMLPRISASNRQHPDHDTDHWVPGGWTAER